MGDSFGKFTSVWRSLIHRVKLVKCSKSDWILDFGKIGLVKKPSQALAAASELSLLSAQDCLEAIFPNPETRPSLRWFQEMYRGGMIPHLKLKRRVFFDPVAVRRALGKYSTTTQEVGQ
jgi:hypothetical protein